MLSWWLFAPNTSNFPLIIVLVRNKQVSEVTSGGYTMLKVGIISVKRKVDNGLIVVSCRKIMDKYPF